MYPSEDHDPDPHGLDQTPALTLRLLDNLDRSGETLVELEIEPGEVHDLGTGEDYPEPSP